MSDICLLLRETRERHGMTLEDVAQKTYIKLPYLQALEEGTLEALPAPVYTYGYIRQYAKLLGLDGSELVARFQQLERHGGRAAAESRSSQSMPDLSGDPYKPFKPNGNGNGANGHSNGTNGHAAPGQFSEALAALSNGGESTESRQARAQAQQILAGAEREAQQLVRGAEKYADEVLSELENEIGKTLQIIRNGRQFLAARRHGGPTGF